MRLTPCVECGHSRENHDGDGCQKPDCPCAGFTRPRGRTKTAPTDYAGRRRGRPHTNPGVAGGHEH